MKKIQNILTVTLSALFLGGFLLAAILTPDKTDLLSERRTLALRPALRASAVADGTYMTAFEKNRLDQFPLRDNFRALKAFFAEHPEGAGQQRRIFCRRSSCEAGLSGEHRSCPARGGALFRRV